jgi:hypothetical protein
LDPAWQAGLLARQFYEQQRGLIDTLGGIAATVAMMKMKAPPRREVGGWVRIGVLPRRNADEGAEKRGRVEPVVGARSPWRLRLRSTAADCSPTSDASTTVATSRTLPLADRWCGQPDWTRASPCANSAEIAVKGVASARKHPVDLTEVNAASCVRGYKNPVAPQSTG